MSARERIGSARLYLVCDARPRAFLEAALRGGVDVLQLRDKRLGDDALIAAAREFSAAAGAAGALFVLNDRPDLVAACGADGVHVGQDASIHAGWSFRQVPFFRCSPPAFSNTSRLSRPISSSVSRQSAVNPGSAT